jgi:AcrR family transcriptional regulator
MVRHSPKRRTYDNSLRTQQAEQTKQRILQALAEQLADTGREELSIAKLAERAGVSEPTVYRHFANKEALFLALDTWIAETTGRPKLHEDVDRFAPFVADLFRFFESNSSLIRASLEAPLGREFRATSRKSRERRFKEVAAHMTKHLDAKDGEAVYAMLRTILRSETWLALTVERGIDSDRAARVVGWVVDLVERELASMKKRGEKTIPDVGEEQ